MDAPRSTARTPATGELNFEREAKAWIKAAEGPSGFANLVGRIMGPSSDPKVAKAMDELAAARETARREVPAGVAKALQQRAPSLEIPDIQKIGAGFLKGGRAVDKGTIIQIVRAIDQASVESAVKDRLSQKSELSSHLNSAQSMRLTQVLASLISKSLPSGARKHDQATLARYADQEFELGERSSSWAAQAGEVLAQLSPADRTEAVTHATNRLEAFSPTLRPDGARAGSSVSGAQAWAEFLLRESLAQFVYTCASQETWGDGARETAQSQLDARAMRVRGEAPGKLPPSTIDEVRAAVKMIAGHANSAQSSTSSLSQSS